ncbi:hypothetical protein LXL04_023412 [Taraxacum kok-saghyz]
MRFSSHNFLPSAMGIGTDRYRPSEIQIFVVGRELVHFICYTIEFVGIKARRIEKYYQNPLNPDTKNEKWKGQIEKAMNFFAGLLLLLMPEENAFYFCLIVSTNMILIRALMGILDDYFEGYYSEEMIETQVENFKGLQILKANKTNMVLSTHSSNGDELYADVVLNSLPDLQQQRKNNLQQSATLRKNNLHHTRGKTICQILTAEGSFAPKPGKVDNVDDSCESPKDTSTPTPAASVDETDTLSDIDDSEVSCYLNNEEESRFKKIIWEQMNKEYMQEQAAKEAAAAAARKLYTRTSEEIRESQAKFPKLKP